MPRRRASVWCRQPGTGLRLAAAACAAATLWPRADAARVHGIVEWGTTAAAAPPLPHLPREVARGVLDAVTFPYRIAAWGARGDLVASLTSQAVGDAVTLYGRRGPGAVLRGQVADAHFFPNSTWLLTWNAAGAKIWDAASGAMLRRLPTSVTKVSYAAVLGTGDRVVTCGSPGVCIVSCAETGRELAAFRHAKGQDGDSLGAEVFPSDGRLLLWGRDVAQRRHDLGPLVWDPSAGAVRCVAEGDFGRGIAFGRVFPGGRRVLTCGEEDRAAVVWDAATCERVWGFAHQSRVRDAAAVADGSVVATLWGSDDLTWRATIWSMDTGEPLRELAHAMRAGDDPRLVSFPQGDRLATVSRQYIAVWDIASGDLVHKLEARYVDGVDVSPTGDFMVACTSLGQLIVFDLANGERLQDFPMKDLMDSGIDGCGVTVGLGGALDPNGFGRGPSWRELL